MAEGKMDKRDVTLQVCNFSAKVYSMHSQINEEKPASMIQRKWKYFGASFNLVVDIVWISCSCLLANKLFLIFIFTMYPSCCNLNLLQFMEFCLMAIPVQKCNIAENNSAPHFSWNSNFSYMRKFFCFLSLRFFFISSLTVFCAVRQLHVAECLEEATTPTEIPTTLYWVDMSIFILTMMIAISIWSTVQALLSLPVSCELQAAG